MVVQIIFNFLNGVYFNVYNNYTNFFLQMYQDTVLYTSTISLIHVYCTIIYFYFCGKCMFVSVCCTYVLFSVKKRNIWFNCIYIDR